MSELPEGWLSKPLSEVADVILGQSPPGSSYNTEGKGMPFFQGKAEFGDLYPEVRKWTTEPKKLAKAGDVLVSVRAPVGPTNVAPLDCSVGRGLAALRVRDSMPTRYLLYALRASSDGLASQATGTTFPAISGSQLRAHHVAVAPPDDQQRIVEAIEEQFSRLDASVESLQRAKRNLTRLRASVLNAAVNGRLIPQESTKEAPRPHPVGNSGLMTQMGTSIPGGWRWARLEELGKMGRGRSRHRPRNDPKLYGGQYPFIQTGDIANSGGRITSHSQTYSAEGFAQSRLWPEKTVCITIAGNIAESALLTYPACFPDSVVGVVADESLVSPEYLEFFMRTAKGNLAEFAPATAQKNINLSILSDVLVPLPPLEEQQHIVTEVERQCSIIDAMAKTIDEGLQRAQVLRQSILRDAFAGRLLGGAGGFVEGLLRDTANASSLSITE